jgi:hypothetical protein
MPLDHLGELKWRADEIHFNAMFCLASAKKRKFYAQLEPWVLPLRYSKGHKLNVRNYLPGAFKKIQEFWVTVRPKICPCQRKKSKEKLVCRNLFF